MIDKSMSEGNLPESGKTAREIHLHEEERRELEARLKQQQEQEDQSLREGFRFLFISIVQFIFYVGAGAVTIIISQKMLKPGSPFGFLLMGAGALLIVKGMFVLGGSHSK